MKRIIAISVIGLLLFSLIGCNSKEEGKTKPSEAITKNSTDASTEQVDPKQQIIGKWELTIDIGLNDNLGNERLLQELKNGEYDNVANKEELYELCTNYIKYQEGTYLYTSTFTFAEDGTCTNTFNEQELRTAYERFFVEFRQHKCETAGIPYTPWEERDLEHEVVIALQTVNSSKLEAATYKIVDGVLFVQGREWGTMTFEDDQLIINRTENSVLVAPRIYTRIS